MRRRLHRDSGRDAAGTDRFDKFLAVHAVSHPFEQMIAMAQLIFGGVFERYPRLRVGFLESGAGWVPFWMDRLDEEWEKRGDVEAPLCKQKPSSYVMSGRCYFGVECEELTIPDAILFRVARGMVAIDPKARSSTLQDLDRKKKTEIDFLNGEIVRLASEHSIDARANSFITESVHRLERSQGPLQFLTADEVLRGVVADHGRSPETANG